MEDLGIQKGRKKKRQLLES